MSMRNKLEDLIMEELDTPMIGTGLMAVSYVDRNGVSKWGWYAFGQQTVTDLLGLNQAIGIQLQDRLINASNTNPE